MARLKQMLNNIYDTSVINITNQFEPRHFVNGNNNVTITCSLENQPLETLKEIYGLCVPLKPSMLF